MVLQFGPDEPDGPYARYVRYDAFVAATDTALALIDDLMAEGLEPSENTAPMVESMIDAVAIVQDEVDKIEAEDVSLIRIESDEQPAS